VDAVTDPLAFLRDALDAAEARAEAARDGDSGEWFVGDKWNVYRVENEAPHDEIEENRLVVYGNVCAQSEHIVANSPAAVLRRIAADRKILALYEKAHAEYPADGHAYDWESDTGRARTAALEEAIRVLAEGWGWTGEAT
jgi:hypothetical protein